MRQAMPGIVVLLLVAHAAQAASYRVVSPVFACIDRRAALSLGDATPDDPHASPRSIAIRRQGHCLSIEPGARWERILSAGGAVLLRRAPPVPGLPPLYFRVDAVAQLPDGASAADVSGSAAPGQGSPVAGTADDGDDVVAPPTQDAAAPAPQIVTEALPPPSSSPAPASPSASLAAEVPATSAQPEADASLTTPAAASSVNLDKAMQQGYVVGFLAAMLLLALVVAVLAGIVWTLLRNARATRDAGLMGRGGATGLSPVLAGGPGGGSGRVRRLVMDDERRRADTGSADPLQFAPVQGGMTEISVAEAPASREGTPQSALPPVAPPPPVDLSGYRSHCLALLEAAGWRTSLRPVAGRPMPDLVAERDGRVLSLLCLPADPPVDEDSIELACVARDRQQADMAAIVSNASFTAPAKLLATQTGVVLLHEDELAAFAA